MKLSCVRPSVCLSIPPGICGGFAAVGPEGTRYRPVASRSAAAAPQQRRATGECGQRHVVS